MMNNKEAYAFVDRKPSIRAAADEFIHSFDLPQSEFHCIRRKFGELKSIRDGFLRNNDLSSWEEMLFYSVSLDHSPKKRCSAETIIFQADLSTKVRKPLSQLTTKDLRFRSAPILKLIDQVAEKEEVDSKIIASY